MFNSLSKAERIFTTTEVTANILMHIMSWLRFHFLTHGETCESEMPILTLALDIS